MNFRFKDKEKPRSYTCSLAGTLYVSHVQSDRHAVRSYVQSSGHAAHKLRVVYRACYTLATSILANTLYVDYVQSVFVLSADCRTTRCRRCCALATWLMTTSLS